MEIVPAEDYAHDRKPKILIYGAPGVGKTILAAQAPKPCLLLDFDQGANYVTNAISTRGLDIAADVTVEELWALATKVSAADGFKYKSIVIDSLTELQNIHRAALLEERLSPTRQDYQINTEFMRRVVRLFQSSDLTIVYTCLEDEYDDLEGVRYRPSLTPALQRSVEAAVPIITYLAMRTVEGENGGTDVERIAVNIQTERFKAKDRTGLLPAKVRDPTWSKVYGALYPKAKKRKRKAK